MKTKKKKIEFTPTPICIVGEKEECVQNQSGRQIDKSTASRKLVWGFTIVELLTVMAVIAMLLGILVPALNLVRRLAKDTNQKAQFHGIEVGIATYGNENDGRYPDSKTLGPAPAAPATNQQTVGAQRLAEALIGRDMLGLDPNTTWDAYYDRNQVGNRYAYASTAAPKNSTATQVSDSLKRREGPYLSVEKTDAFQVGQLFTSTFTVYDGITAASSPAPVLTDTYRVKKVTVRGKTMMAGTPILYYKANAASLTFPDTNSVTTVSLADDSNSIYSSLDNEQLVRLYQMMKPQSPQQQNMHRFDPRYDAGSSRDGVWVFYDTITNKQITSQARPVNMTSYILMSAGYDGIYGTRDDIYNFE